MNINSQQAYSNVVAGNTGVVVNDVQPLNILVQQKLANVVAGNAGADVNDVQLANILVYALTTNVVAGSDKSDALTNLVLPTNIFFSVFPVIDVADW